MSGVPVILQVLAKQDPSVKKTLADIAAETRKIMAPVALPVPTLPESATARLKLAEQLLAQMRTEAARTGQELVGVRDGLNELGKSTDLIKQAEGYVAVAQRLKQIGAASEEVRKLNPVLEASFKSLTQSAEAGLERVAAANELVFRRRKAVEGASLGDELSFVQAQTKLFETGSAQEVALVERAAALKKQVRDKEAADAKASADKQVAALQQVADKANLFAGQSRVVAGTLGAGSAILGGVAAGAVTVASRYEQLRATLVSVTGSVAAANKEFDYAAQYAAQSPFDIEGIVKATTIIRGFQQSSEQLLPVASNLSAAMGVDLQQAALAVAKAAAGSYEGFENLRNTFAIQTPELQKYGAEVDNTGTLLIKTTEQIKKAREAMVQIVNTRYGDAVARQSATLAGAVSNVGDSAANLAAAFGQALIPAFTQGARATAFLLNGLNLVPGPLKALGAAGVVALAGIAGLGAAGAGAVAGLFALQANLASAVLQLRQLKVEAPQAAAALQLVNAGVTRASGALTASNLAATGLRLGFLGLAGVAATVGLAVADAWEKSAIAQGDAIADSSRKMAAGNAFFKQAIAGLNEAGRATGKTVEVIGNSAEQMRAVNQAFRELPADAIVRGLMAMGATAESLTSDLKQAEEQAEKSREELRLLMDLRAEMAKGPDKNLEKIWGISGQLAERGFSGIGNSDAVDKAIESQEKLNGRVGVTVQVARQSKEAFDTVLTPLKEAVTASQNLGKLLDLAKSVGSTNALQVSLTAVNALLDKNAKLAQIGTTNLDDLFARAADPKNAPYLAAITEQINKVKERDSILDTLARKEEERAKNEIAAEDLKFRRKKALTDVSLTQEIQHIQSQLKQVEKGSEEEVRLLEALASKKKELRDKMAQQAEKSAKAEADSARKAFEAVLRNAGQGVADAKAGITPGTPTTGPATPYPLAGGQNAGVAPSVLDALDEAKNRVNAWAAANASLLRQYPALAAELAKFRSSNAIERQRVETEKLRDNLQKLGQDISTSITEATNSSSRLAAVENGILQTQQSKRAGFITEQGAQAQINSLTKQKLSIEQQIRQEKAQQAAQTQNLELQNTELSIQTLEARKAAGENVERELVAARASAFQHKLAILEAETAAAIAAANGEASTIEAIQRNHLLKLDNLKGQETLRRLNEFGKVEQAHDASLKRMEARQFERIGGKNSPLQGFEEAFSGFSFSNFDLDSTANKVVAPAKAVAARGGFNTPFRQAEQAMQKVAATTPRAAPSGPLQVTNNQTVVVQGQKLGREHRKATKEFLKSDGIQKALTRGEEYPGSAYPNTL